MIHDNAQVRRAEQMTLSGSDDAKDCPPAPSGLPKNSASNKHLRALHVLVGKFFIYKRNKAALKQVPLTKPRTTKAQKHLCIASIHFELILIGRASDS
jgi:hypothetical protein